MVTQLIIVAMVLFKEEKARIHKLFCRKFFCFNTKLALVCALLFGNFLLTSEILAVEKLKKNSRPPTKQGSKKSLPSDNAKLIPELPKENRAGYVVSASGEVTIKRVLKTIKKNLPRPLKDGESIFQGDTINTGKNGMVKILFRDKSIVDIGTDSKFEVTEYHQKTGAVNDRKVGFDLDHGKVRTLVSRPLKRRGRFKLKTRGATMGVRGTEFFVKAEKFQPLPAGSKPPRIPVIPKTEVVVLEGKVSLSSNARAPGSRQASSMTLTTGSQFSSAPSIVGNGRGIAGTGTGQQVTTGPGAQGPQIKRLSGAEMKSVRAETSELKSDHTFSESVSMDDVGSGAETITAAMDTMTNMDLKLEFSAEDWVPDFDLPLNLFELKPSNTAGSVKVNVSFSP